MMTTNPNMPVPRYIFRFIPIFFAQIVSAQTGSQTFQNYGRAFSFFGKDSIYSNSIHEVTLHPDSTFEFWSRPHVSCLTWRDYKGNWKKDKDTVFFFDSYELKERVIRSTYMESNTKVFLISFKTDRKSTLRNRDIELQFVYNYDDSLGWLTQIFQLRPDNTLEIPFDNIPHFDKLASIRIDYRINFTERRFDFLTQNEAVNVRKCDIPNIIHVEFVENPKKETVYRTIKAIVKEDNLIILTENKTKGTLYDYSRPLEFQDIYRSRK